MPCRRENIQNEGTCRQTSPLQIAKALTEQSLFEEDRFEDIQDLQILSTKMYQEEWGTSLGSASPLRTRVAYFEVAHRSILPPTDFDLPFEQ